MFRVNKALLYSNMGRLMRLCAQVYGYSTRQSLEEHRGQFTQEEKTYFSKVIILIKILLMRPFLCNNLFASRIANQRLTKKNVKNKFSQNHLYLSLPHKVLIIY